MLITDDFVLLSFPRTGTTFTRKVIKKIYGNKFEELLLPVIFNHRASGRISQHGTYTQIPMEHRGKTILSIVRNPFDRYASQFFFKWFAHSPPESEEKLREAYPDFPEIDFLDFLDMLDKFGKRNILETHKVFSGTDIGFQTVQFVAFYSSNPERDLKELVKGGTESILKLPKIHFLRQEFLREDLFDFLVGLLGDIAIAGIISSEKHENVSRLGRDRDWKKMWTPDLFKLYSQKELPFLNIFPEYKENSWAKPVWMEKVKQWIS
jgi:hypothetical protein